jgi:hypothetical protein
LIQKVAVVLMLMPCDEVEGGGERKRDRERER